MVIRRKPSEDAFLPFRKQLDSDGKYALVDPRSLYRGKSYSDWTTDWFNWFLSADADKRNFGPVVFLRSHGLPRSNTNLPDLSDSSSDGHITENDYPSRYVNDPNIRVGNDRLQIFDDQAVFVPIIVAYQLGGTVATYRDWGNMEDQVGSIIDNGDNPPEPMQLTIDNVPISLEDGKGTSLVMEDFRITTPIFTAIVPEVPYKTSIKDFLEEGSIPAGSYPSMVDGYFVMLMFNAGTYWVHSWASAAREARGPYFSELLYQIEVGTRPERVKHGRITTIRPARNQALFEHIAQKKQQLKELRAEDVPKMEGYFGSLMELDQSVSLQELRVNQQANQRDVGELLDKVKKSKDWEQKEENKKIINDLEEKMKANQRGIDELSEILDKVKKSKDWEQKEENKKIINDLEDKMKADQRGIDELLDKVKKSNEGRNN